MCAFGGNHPHWLSPEPEQELPVAVWSWHPHVLTFRSGDLLAGQLASMLRGAAQVFQNSSLPCCVHAKISFQRLIESSTYINIRTNDSTWFENLTCLFVTYHNL